MTARVVAPEWVVSSRADRVLGEGLDGRGWGVSPAPLQRGSAFTDFGQAHMAVPVGDDPASAAVRLHEMVHASISPSSLPNALVEQIGVTLRSVRIAEEMRVNMVARHVGTCGSLAASMDDLTDGSEVSSAKNAVDRRNWNDAVALYLQTYNTGVHKSVRRALIRVPEWRESFDLIEKHLEVYSWKYRALSGYNANMTTMNLSATDAVEYVWFDGSSGELCRNIIPSGFRYSLDMATVIEDWMKSPPARNASESARVTVPRGRAARTNWAELRFGITALTEPTANFIGRRKRPAITGKHPSRPDRLLTDPERRIFREVVRGGNAVVVFDCSGSMSVTHDMVRRAVERFAGATIAVYTQQGAHNANTWVVARNGRMMSRTDFDALPLGNGNGVDYPVLRWAVNQRRTSKDFVLWVSDGYVTGRNDIHDENLLDECLDLSLRERIVGVDTPEEAIELLDRMKRTGAVPRGKLCGHFQQRLDYRRKWGK